MKLPLVYSYINTDNYSFILLLLSITFIPSIYRYNKKLFFTYIIISIISLYILSIKNTVKLIKPNINIKLVHTDINQNDKFKPKNIDKFYKQNFNNIQKAILEKKDAIVFPESAFDIPINQDYDTIYKLKKYSNKITIIAGSMYIDSNYKYNSTYIFSDNKMRIIHKYILTPFGERVPLAEVITNTINKIFFDGSSDFNKADNYGEYTIKDYTFRNAICFEATRDEIYKNNPPYLIAISNNAWFSPSIQSTIQNIYLKYMSNKYKTIIYHSSNKGFNDILY
jgi:apolipoprotein N-acyltransferase